MPEKGVRSQYSQCPFQIYMYDSHGIISTGTAFYFENNQEHFLVTNWHNLSGKNCFSKDSLTIGRHPTYIKAKLSTYINPEKVHFTTLTHEIKIYKNEAPLWFEHPQLGSNCDVIAIPIERSPLMPEFMHKPANKISDLRVPVEPGSTAFIIGFPSSISTGFGLPVWKSGFIASEPHYDITLGGQISDYGGLINGLTLPAFFLDTLSRQGMSGSPVFCSYVGTWDMKEPYSDWSPSDPDFFNNSNIAIGGKGFEFVGIYSGRISRKEDEAALGLCWKKETIELICTEKVLGKHPHIL